MRIFGALILSSSLWEEAPEVRLLFLWFLAQADEDGYVPHHSIGTLARLANIEMPTVPGAIHVLESPDPNSRSADHDGRRLLPVDGGGWFVVNAKAYREIKTVKQVRDAERMREMRAQAMDKIR